MPSKLEIAQNNFKDGLNYLQKLLDNKEKIKEGLEELSFGVRGNNYLFEYYFNEIYDFLEDDFGPQIKDIENQIDKGKLSKRQYKILLEDSSDGEKIDIFWRYLRPIHKLYNEEGGLMREITNKNKKAWFGFNKLYDWVDILTYTINPIENIIKYGLDEDRVNEDYFYFTWYSSDKEEPHSNIEDKNEEIMDDYYTQNLKSEIKQETPEQKKVPIYKDMRLISKDGKTYKKITGLQKTLCEYIFENGYLKDRSFYFSTLELELYGESQKSIEAIKSVIKEVKKKLTDLGYVNIMEYGDETLITSKK